MGAPQIIFIVIASIELLVHAIKHGEIREFNISMRIIDTTLMVGLLFWGGFFG